MPCEVHWEDGGFYWRFSGRVVGDEILRLSLGLFMDPRFRGMKYVILHAFNVSDYQVSAEETRKLAEYNAEVAGLAPGLKLAVVADRGEMEEQASWFAREMADYSWEVAVFQDLETAREWVESK